MTDGDQRKVQLAADLRAEFFGKYPDLRVSLDGGTIRVTGSYPVVHEGRILDRFLIEIVLPDNFPNGVPVLREIGGRIPHISDRHINQNGDACPLVPEEWLLLPIEQRTVIGFLEGPVRAFFVGQSLVESGHPWPLGERPHGRPGLIESYGEMLGVNGEEAVKRYLEVLSGKRIKGHWPCPCGSGQKLRNCHIEQIGELQGRIPRHVARSALDRLLAPAPRSSEVTRKFGA